jgi:hypothetical protein
VRNATISVRAVQATGAGARLRAAASPSGSESITPTAVAMIAICRLSIMPLVSSCSLSGATLGGNMRERKREPCSSPVRKRAQVISRMVPA